MIDTLETGQTYYESMLPAFRRFMIFLCSFFFFSSRRRHTRSLCDWSSDVCSSDLDCHLLDLGAFAADHNPGTRRVNRHPDAVPGPLDHDLRDGGKLELLLHIIANLKIAVEKSRHFLGRGVPLRTPVAVHPETKTNWINFLSHKLFFAC